MSLIQSTQVYNQPPLNMKSIKSFYDKLIKDYKAIEAKMFLHLYTSDHSD